MIASSAAVPPTAPPITAPETPPEGAEASVGFCDAEALVEGCEEVSLAVRAFRAPKYVSWSGRPMTVGSSWPTGHSALCLHGSSLQQPQKVVPAVQV